MPFSITKEWFILCEGVADKAFFSQLISERGLPDFQIQAPLRAGDVTGGWTKYSPFLNDIKINEGFSTTLKAILVIADSDSNPPARFQGIQDQINWLELAQRLEVQDVQADRMIRHQEQRERYHARHQ